MKAALVVNAPSRGFNFEDIRTRRADGTQDSSMCKRLACATPICCLLLTILSPGPAVLGHEVAGIPCGG